MMNMRADLEQKGLSLKLALNSFELSQVMDAVTQQWLRHHESIDRYRRIVIAENSYGIQDHHKISTSERQNDWPKISRVLGKEFLGWFLGSNFYDSLTSQIGSFDISDEEDLGWGNIYFRLVRPSKPYDVGPLHRDSWFWNANEQYSMKGRSRRIKVWIPLVCEQHVNGLLVEENSHKRNDLKWEIEERDGIKKPVFDRSRNNVNMTLVNRRAGQAIVFHDELLHGGMINSGKDTRVSIEFTCLVG